MNKITSKLITLASLSLMLVSPIAAKSFNMTLDSRMEGVVDIPANDASVDEKTNVAMELSRFRLDMKAGFDNDWSARVRLRFDKSADKDPFNKVSHMVNYAYVQKKWEMFKLQVGVIDFSDGFEDDISGSQLFLGSIGASEAFGNEAGISGTFSVAKQNLSVELVNSGVVYSSDPTAQVYPNLGVYYTSELADGKIQPMATYTFQPVEDNGYFSKGTTVFGGGVKYEAEKFEFSIEYAGNYINADGDVSDTSDVLNQSIIYIGALKGKHSPLLHLSYNMVTEGGKKDYNSILYSAAYRYNLVEKLNLVAAVSAETKLMDDVDPSTDMKINLGVQGKLKFLEIKD